MNLFHFHIQSDLKRPIICWYLLDLIHQIACLIICQKHYPKMVMNITSCFIRKVLGRSSSKMDFLSSCFRNNIIISLIAPRHISVIHFDLELRYNKKKMSHHSSASFYSFPSHWLLKHSERETTIFHFSFHNQTIIYPNTSQSTGKML